MYHRPLFLLLTVLFLAACGNSDHGYAETGASVEKFSADYADDEIEMEPPRTAQPPTPPEQKATQPKIIYTASVRGRVTNLDSALLAVGNWVQRRGGYLSSQQRTNSNWEHSATLVLRLPATELSPALAFLPGILLETNYQNMNANDVTAEWIDLESRLQTKREVRDRYIDILRNKARKVEDILAAEDKIRVITEEIEARESRLRYLRDQVSMSTLTLELYQTREYKETGPVTRRTFGSEFVAALGNGWSLIRELFLGLTAVWPLLILIGAGIWLVRRWRR